MSYHPCISGCGRFLAPEDGHNRCLACLGIQHTEEAFVDGSCSSSGDMTISELRNRLRYVRHGGDPLPLLRSSVFPGTRGGAVSGGVRGDLRVTVRASQEEFLTLKCSAAGGIAVGAGWGHLQNGVNHLFPSVLPWRPDFDCCIGGRALSLRDDDPAALPPSGVVALSEPRPRDDGYAFRAAEKVGLVWNPPPRPDPSRLDEWFLGGVVLVLSAPPSGAILPEVHEELTRSWRHLSWNKSCSSPPSAPSMLEPLWGTRASPRWSGAKTCTRVVTTWRFYMSCVLQRTSCFERQRWPHILWVVRCPR